MNVLSKIFGKTRNTASQAVPENNEITGLGNPIARDLFVDDEPPAKENEPIQTGSDSIQAFLEQDFYGTGYRDGYNYHSSDMMNAHIRSLMASFRLKIDLAIDKKRQNLLELRTHNIGMDGISERMLRQIEAIEADFRAMIDRLEREKSLSADDEGWVMKPVNDYRDGFLRGAETYNEERLIASTTGLFN